jgi:hypothetical protein
MLRFLAAFLFSHAHIRRKAAVGRWTQPITQRRVLSMIQVERQESEVTCGIKNQGWVQVFPRACTEYCSSARWISADNAREWTVGRIVCKFACPQLNCGQTAQLRTNYTTADKLHNCGQTTQLSAFCPGMTEARQQLTSCPSAVALSAAKRRRRAGRIGHPRSAWRRRLILRQTGEK